MDHKLIKQFTSYFLMDNYILYDESSQNKIDDLESVIEIEIIEILHHARDNDLEYYEEFQDFSLLQQQKVITELSFGICYDLNIPLNNSDNNKKLEEGILNTGYDWLVSTLNFAADNWLISSTIAVITFILVVLNQRKITTNIVKIGAGLGEGLANTGKLLVRHGRYWKFRYAIVQQNVKQCYSECGVTDLSKLGFVSYWNASKIDEDKLINSKSECLGRCYIEQHIIITMMIFKLYLICLKSTGKFDTIRDIGEQQLVAVFFNKQNIRPNYMLSSACEEYYSIIADNFEKFNDLLNFAFKSEVYKHEAMKNLYSQMREITIEIKRTPIDKLKQKYNK